MPVLKILKGKNRFHFRLLGHVKKKDEKKVKNPEEKAKDPKEKAKDPKEKAKDPKEKAKDPEDVEDNKNVAFLPPGTGSV